MKLTNSVLFLGLIASTAMARPVTDPPSTDSPAIDPPATNHPAFQVGPVTPFRVAEQGQIKPAAAANPTEGNHLKAAREQLQKTQPRKILKTPKKKPSDKARAPQLSERERKLQNDIAGRAKMKAKAIATGPKYED